MAARDSGDVLSDGSPQSPASQRPASPFTSPSSTAYQPEPAGPVAAGSGGKSDSGHSPPFHSGGGSDSGEEGREHRAKVHRPSHWARDVTAYDILGTIGEGTYGKVWKARDPLTNEVVALKMIKTSEGEGSAADGGFPITSIREIRILRTLQHENIVSLKEVVEDRQGTVEDGKKGAAYMVFEYLEYDLWGLANHPDMRLQPVHIKTYMKQLLKAVHYMHSTRVMHRDLKCANLLIGANGMLKVGDWGLARSFHDNQHHHTGTVITMWYRPPEVLLRTSTYGPEVDMWSVGCILGELLYKEPILPGKTEVEQLDLIFTLCGTPNQQNWPTRAQLPDWKSWTQKVEENPRERSLKHKFRKLDPDGVDLVDRMLALDPAKRITASQALDHAYFWHKPAPVEPHELPTFQIQSCHELEAKARRQQDREKRREDERQLREAARERAAAGAGSKPAGSDEW